MSRPDDPTSLRAWDPDGDASDPDDIHPWLNPPPPDFYLPPPPPPPPGWNGDGEGGGEDCSSKTQLEDLQTCDNLAVREKSWRFHTFF